MIEQDSINIRLAKLTDAELLLSWRNDRETRANSINHAVVTRAEHIDWLNAKIKDENCKIIIGEDVSTGSYLGVVIFQYCETQDDTTVSITVAPNMRGKGVGVMLLRKAISNHTSNKPLVLTAKIRKDNFKSLKIFDSNGFAQYHEEDGLIILKNKITIIDEIERIRSRNNVNWMNLMRLAFKSAPHRAEEIFANINNDDQRISDLLKQLTKR